MANRIGLDVLSVLGMNPVDYVELAGRLGCGHVGMAAAPIVFLGELFEAWSLRENPALVRAVKAAIAETGVSVAVGEGLFIRPGADVDLYATDLDILAHLGVPGVTACAFEPDLPRAFDQFARLAELAGERGMGAQVEFVPGMSIGDLPIALAVAAHVARPGFGIVIDAMHLFRSGATAADVAAMDPALIAHVQLCDCPWEPAPEGHGAEAGSERLCPGEGDLPLASLIAVLPTDKVIGLEIPMTRRALAGESAEQRLRPCVEATERLLA